jgi:hypothetical protein
MVSFTSKDRAFYGPPSQMNSLLAPVRRGLSLAAVGDTSVRGSLKRTKQRFAPISYSTNEVVVYR